MRERSVHMEFFDHTFQRALVVRYSCKDDLICEGSLSVRVQSFARLDAGEQVSHLPPPQTAAQR